MQDSEPERLEVPEGPPTLQIPKGQASGGRRENFIRYFARDELRAAGRYIRLLRWAAVAISVPGFVVSAWFGLGGGIFSLYWFLFFWVASFVCLLLGGMAAWIGFVLHQARKCFPDDAQISKTPPQAVAVLTIFLLVALDFVAPFAFAAAYPYPPNGLDIRIVNDMANSTNVHLVVWGQENVTIIERDFSIPPAAAISTGPTRTLRGFHGLNLTVDGNRSYETGFPFSEDLVGHRLTIMEDQIVFTFWVF